MVTGGHQVQNNENQLKLDHQCGGALRTAKEFLTDYCCRFLSRLYSHRRDKLKCQLTDRPDIRSILVFNPVAGLGNLILLTGLLSALRQRFPKARLLVLMPKSMAAEVILGKDLVDEILFLPPSGGSRLGLLRIGWRKLRPLGLDLALGTFFEPTLTTSLLLASSGARYRVAFTQKHERGFLNTISLTDQGGHEADRHLRLLEFAGRHFENRTEFSSPLVLHKAARKWLNRRHMGISQPLVGIHPGSDFVNSAKRWPAEKFAILARRLVAETTCDILIFLGPDDRDLKSQLASLEGSRIRLITDKPLDFVISLVDNCDGFVSNDSGMMHIASALGVPVVAIFGPTSPEKNSPVGPGCVLIAAGVECRPCYRNSPIICHQDLRYCLEEISPDTVFQQLMVLLANHHADTL